MRILPLMLLLAMFACDGKDTSPAPPPSASPTAAATPSASAKAAAPAEAAAPARPLYFEREIKLADLEGRTLRELSLLRNSVYARAHNTFRRPWLDAHFRAQPWYEPRDKMDESKISALDKTNARAVAEFDASITREDLERRRDEALARKKAGAPLPEDAVELSLLSQRLGAWLGGAEDGRKPTPLEDPSKLDALLTVEQLSTLSRRDLRVLRNTVYARRGRSFDSKVVRSYFEGATWYQPRADYHDGLLSGVDHKNIRIVRSVEDSLGGPLHENPNYGKDWWFFQA